MVSKFLTERKERKKMGLVFIFDANVCLDIIHSLVNSSKIYFGYNNYQSLNRKLSEFFPPSYENITLKLH